MILLGTIVNCAAIVAGSLAGTFLRNLKKDTQETVTRGIGLGVIALGIQMAIQNESFILILISLCLGAMVGEFLGIENQMKRLGLFLEKRFAKPGSNFAEGFVTATLIFLIGSMAIIGAIESGVSNNHQILFTKSVMDGFMAIMLTASLGVDVLFSAVPVLVYQGLITIFSSFLMSYIPNELLEVLMTEISAIGGLMILAIGFNILGIVKIRVSNYLPGLLFLILFVSLGYYYF